MINSVTINGNCATEVKLNDKGKASVLLAYDESFKVEGEVVKRSSFMWVECYGKLAQNLSQYKSKGDPITVQGRLTGGTYQDKEGNWQNGLRVKATIIQFHHRKQQLDSIQEEESNEGDSISE
ncbi:MAG: single-stranded DNA-binding protein [Crocosphaera sp.]